MPDTTRDELRRLAESAIASYLKADALKARGFSDVAEKRNHKRLAERLAVECTPATVLALLDELEMAKTSLKHGKCAQCGYYAGQAIHDTTWSGAHEFVHLPSPEAPSAR